MTVFNQTLDGEWINVEWCSPVNAPLDTLDIATDVARATLLAYLNSKEADGWAVWDAYRTHWDTYDNAGIDEYSDVPTGDALLWEQACDAAQRAVNELRLSGDAALCINLL